MTDEQSEIATLHELAKRQADYTAKLEAEVERLRGWQDISTAPRDGAAVLVWAEREGWTGKPRVVCASFGGLGPTRWTIYGCGPTKHSEQWLDHCTPTHWRPLPAPPEAAE